MLMRMLKNAHEKLSNLENEVNDGCVNPFPDEFQEAEVNLLKQFRKFCDMDQHGIMIMDDGTYYRMNPAQVQRTTSSAYSAG